MASIYLRPTADIFDNFTLFPEGSTNGYSLIDDEVPDGSSTYIGVKCDTADVRVTKSGSFAFAGVPAPDLDEYVITDVKIGGTVYNGSYASSVMTFDFSSNGLRGISDPIEGSASLLSFESGSFETKSFDRNGDIARMFNDYAKKNGRLPDVNLLVTLHGTSTKANYNAGITQLYIDVVYNACFYEKQEIYHPPQFLYSDGYYTHEWVPITRVYKKTNGVWSPTRAGLTQIKSQLNKKGGHRLVKLARKSETCGKTGLTEGCKCSVCDITFVEQQVIPATGAHTPTEVAAVEPTCVAGNTAGTKCSVCGITLSGNEVIPATGNHTPKEVAAEEPTCKNNGYTAGTKCSVCGTWLSGHETIPVDPENHTPTEVAAVEPTCVAGNTAGTKCSVCGITLSGNEVIPAIADHTPVSNNDGVAATTLDMGLESTISCSVCGKKLTGYKTIPSLGHTCTPITVAGKAPTCASTGLTDGQICSVCGKVLEAQQVIPATGVHTSVIIPRVEPTCVSTGLTQGEKCSVCGKILVAQQVIPATGVHTYVTSGNYQICSVCGYVKELDVTGIVYKYSTTALSLPRDQLSATTVGNYALFGGGYYNDDNADITDGFNASFTRVSVSRLQNDTFNSRNAATTVGNYALFAGGECDLNKGARDVTAYDLSLTRSYPSDLTVDASRLAATTVGSYALFGGGYEYFNYAFTKTEDWKYNVTAYNTSLTQSTASNLSQEKAKLAATTVGNYALFGGGERNGTVSNTVDTYNTSLTKGTAATLSVARDDLAATTVGSYAIFGGGWSGSDVNTTDAYDQNLTKVSIAPLSVARDQLAATTVGDYALFGGGDGTNYVDIYDKNLTKIPAIKLSSSRKFLAATTLGNYALFGGGNDGSMSDKVDIFTIR